MNRSNIITTRTGIQIGGHYIPPAPQPEADAERIQRAYIEKPNKQSDMLTSAASLAAIAALAVILAVWG